MISINDLEELINIIKASDGNVFIKDISIYNDWDGKHIKIKYYNNDGFLTSEEKCIENIE